MTSDRDPTSLRDDVRSDAVREVVRLAGRARLLRIVAAWSALLVLVVASVAVAAAVDAVVRFPMPIRVVVLGVIVSLVAIDVRKFVMPALRFRPRPIEIAQRIERQRPELAGHLASAVDFELTGVARTNELAAYAVRNLEDRARGVELGAVLRRKPTVVRVIGALGCVAFVAGFSVLQPTYARIALSRVVTPWTDASWPARTGVESLIADGGVAPKGSPVALRAKLTKGDASAERVFARYRVVSSSGEVVTPWTEVALSRQPSGEFERIVDAGGDRIEFLFTTRDAETDVRSIRLVEPPKVVEARATVSSPGYARRVVPARDIELGDGTEARSTVRDPVLEGSVVRLEMRMSRPIAVDGDKPMVWMIGSESPQGAPAASVGAEGGAVDGADPKSKGAQRPTAAAAAASRVALAPAVDANDPAKWSIEFVARGPARIETQLVDADGIRQSQPALFVFDTIADRAPTAAIVEPTQDESVVADARVPMRAECRDDLELRQAGIEIATRLGRADAESLVFEERAEISEAAAAAGVERMLEIAKLGLGAGDSVVLRAFAEDHFDGLGAPAAAHARARSAPRILRIVGEEEFERQIRSAFAGVRRDAMRADERQSKVREQLERDPKDATLAQAQASVTEGVARMREAIEQAKGRLSRNGRASGALAELSNQAEDLAAAAEARSAEAAEALERAQRDAKTAQEREQRAQDAKQAAERQDDVRAELEDLIGLLDRDEDAWVARRRLESLTNRIRQLARETQQAAQRANGESREQLSPESRAELDALAERQSKAAEEAEKTIAEMKERGRALAQSDPQQSRTLDASARAAEDGKVREEMEQAAQDTEQNRLEQSKAAQDRAVAALEQAAQALQEDQKVRAKELSRMMEDLVRSIRRLIEDTEARKAQLDAIPEGNGEQQRIARDPLAGEFGRLSQNTRGVASDARARSREAARAARSLDLAAVSMAAVAAQLRANDYSRADANGAVDSALKNLADALKQAEEAAQRAEDRATEEKRQELVGKYREFLERETVLRGSVLKIVPEADKPIGRRELVESRRLGTIQEELRAEIRTLVDSTAELKESAALIDMHETIDDSLADAKQRLSEGKPRPAVTGQEEAIELLAAIVYALDEKNVPGEEDMFAEKQQQDEGQGGGGGASSGAVPPAAEVKMLRAMQERIARKTRALDEGSPTLQPVERAQQVAELAARQQRILELGAKLAEKIRGGGKPVQGTEATSDGPPSPGGADTTDRPGQPKEPTP